MANDYKWIRNAGMASTVGLVLVLSIGIGVFIGYMLDLWLGTSPWLLIIFTLFGAAAGFIEMIKMVIRLSKD